MRGLRRILGLAVAVTIVSVGLTTVQAQQEGLDLTELMAQAAAPGEHHKHLEQAVGTWDATVKLWMAPGAPPMETKGVAKNKLILGGRFLQMKFEGEVMGQPFQGVGLEGYDNSKKKHVGIWADNLSTMIMGLEGECDGDGKVRTMYSQYEGPDGMQKVKTIITMESAKRHRYESWTIPADGDPVKTMEIVYTKQ